jgi:hypothetical protein
MNQRPALTANAHNTADAINTFLPFLSCRGRCFPDSSTLVDSEITTLLRLVSLLQPNDIQQQQINKNIPANKNPALIISYEF